jgi:hypothetical protein
MIATRYYTRVIRRPKIPSTDMKKIATEEVWFWSIKLDHVKFEITDIKEEMSYMQPNIRIWISVEVYIFQVHWNVS